MGKLKAIKGFGKAYEAFKKAGVIGEKKRKRSGKEIISKGKEPSEIDKAFKGMRDHFKKVEKSPEMKAYRKQENWPKPKYSKEDWSMKKYKEKLKNEKNKK
jgi:hypothetical protein